MSSTNPKEILHTLHLIRAGLASGLLNKEEVIDWADQIITNDEDPNIFFIDLAMSSLKSINDILHYFNEYLDFENASVQGRPLLGLLYSRFKNGQFTLEQTVSKLFQLRFEAIFNEKEQGCIYSIENDFDCAKHGIYGSFENVRVDIEKFLDFYRDYSIYNCDQWQYLDKEVEYKLELDYQLQQKETEKFLPSYKPWWKFWQ